MTENELLNTLLDERMHYEVGQPIRFRVDSVEWQDIRPEPAVDDHPAVPNGAGADSIPEKDPYEKAGFKILVRSRPTSRCTPDSTSPNHGPPDTGFIWI